MDLDLHGESLPCPPGGQCQNRQILQWKPVITSVGIGSSKILTRIRDGKCKSKRSVAELR